MGRRSSKPWGTSKDPDIIDNRGGKKGWAASKPKTGVSVHEEHFVTWLNLENITGWVREYKFHPKRRWRYDFAWPDRKIAVEIDDLTHFSYWSRIASDAEKYNEAMKAGWRVFRYTTNYKQYEQIKKVLTGEEEYTLHDIPQKHEVRKRGRPPGSKNKPKP